MTDEREGRAAARDAIKQSHYHSIHGNREGRCSRPLKADACLALSSLASSSRRRFRCGASGMSPRPPTSRLLVARAKCGVFLLGNERWRCAITETDDLSFFLSLYVCVCFFKKTSTRSTRTAIPSVGCTFSACGYFRGCRLFKRKRRLREAFLRQSCSFKDDSRCVTSS